MDIYKEIFFNIKKNINFNNYLQFLISYDLFLFTTFQDYTLNGTAIKQVEKIRDLGIILDSKWTFQDHIDMVISKSFRTLGLIKRITSHFTSLNTIVYLFKTLVIPNINYCSVIWSPYTNDKFDRLNSIMKNFLRYASYKSGKPMEYNNHNYKEISLECNIYKVESIHKYNDVMFVLNNLKGSVISPDFQKNFKERDLIYDLRDPRPFQEEVQRKDFLYNSPIHRLRRRWNILNQDCRNRLIDINIDGKTILKEKIFKNF